MRTAAILSAFLPTLLASPQPPRGEPQSPDALASVHQPLGKPVVGVVSLPTAQSIFEDVDGASVVPTRYVEWLHAGGADVVPLVYSDPIETLDALLGKIDAIFFTGGGDDQGIHGLAFPDRYVNASKYLYEAAKKSSLEGKPFPVWGTCQGFQMLAVLAAGDRPSVIQATYGTEPSFMHLNFTAAAAASRLFGAAPQEVMEALGTKNVTSNLHAWGVLQETFEESQYGGHLPGRVRLLSTNTDARGQVFGSAYEAVEWPMYATQFHPELPPSNVTKVLDPSRRIEPSPEEKAANLYFAKFLAGEASRNRHRRFASVEEEKNYLIDRYHWVNSPYGPVYAFPGPSAPFPPPAEKAGAAMHRDKRILYV
eukprot:TRINITY_DN46738_c0_g1_i1.p1 TRINITY_DN46738_c0_g1~~TRINITY_DN46738_c0_g1_i1.p1  ORF type:complete len:367 (-),score=81.79 TRINITY_DN46738_c0_g1_i1:101-1201(-)